MLIDLGVLDAGQVWDLLEEARISNHRIGQVAVSRGLISQAQLQLALRQQALWQAENQ
jgi:hypothetical protein